MRRSLNSRSKRGRGKSFSVTQTGATLARRPRCSHVVKRMRDQSLPRKDHDPGCSSIPPSEKPVRARRLVQESCTTTRMRDSFVDRFAVVLETNEARTETRFQNRISRRDASAELFANRANLDLFVRHLVLSACKLTSTAQVLEIIEFFLTGSFFFVNVFA